MIRKMLIAYDGSEPADKAFDCALEIAAKFSAKLEVAGVIRPPDFGGAVESTAMIEQGKKAFHEQTRKLYDRARRAGISVHSHSLVGHPGDQIIRYAAEGGIDLIVLGFRGKSGVARWLTGSTTKQVMGHAHCSVLIVR
jgi:nucleotide-binding universal stress UspA family protein